MSKKVQSPSKTKVQRSSFYYSEPDKIVVSKVAGKIIIPGLKNPEKGINDIICATGGTGSCVIQCLATDGNCVRNCQVNCSDTCGTTPNCTSNCQTNCNDTCKDFPMADQLPIDTSRLIIDKLKLKTKTGNLDAHYGEIVEILNSMKRPELKKTAPKNSSTQKKSK